MAQRGADRHGRSRHESPCENHRPHRDLRNNGRHGHDNPSRDINPRAVRTSKRSRERRLPSDSPNPPPRRGDRSRSIRRHGVAHGRQQVHSQRPHATGYAYGEGRRTAAAAAVSGGSGNGHARGMAPTTRAPVGYAYGEGRRAVADAADLNGRAREHGSHKAAARNALIPVGRRPCAPARLGNLRRGGPGLKKSESYSAEETLSSECSQSSSGSGSSYTVDDEEEEEEVKEVKPAAKKASGKDEIVHFEWRSGMIMNLKYELTKALGDGTFGRVVAAYDRRDNRQVAIKIIRDVKRYMENAKIEADILKDVRKADPEGTSRCLIMHETFTHERKYYCLVSEPLGVSLYDFMKKNAFRGFWMQDIQSFAEQCMQAMDFLHTSLRLAHTDLKPENILLQSQEPPNPAHFFREAEWQGRRPNSKVPPPYVRPANSLIKIIDFGNATYESQHHSSIINTRQYRGPEVVLEMPWTQLSDIWSLGCIFLELYTGELLFGTHDNCEHLALMEKVLSDPLPICILDKTPSQVKEKYLCQDPRTHSWSLDWPAKAPSPASEQHVQNARSLSNILKEPRHKTFLACASFMLTAEQSQRPSAAQVLQQPFFTTRFDD